MKYLNNLSLKFSIMLETKAKTQEFENNAWIYSQNMQKFPLHISSSCPPSSLRSSCPPSSLCSSCPPLLFIVLVGFNIRWCVFQLRLEYRNSLEYRKIGLLRFFPVFGSVSVFVSHVGTQFCEKRERSCHLCVCNYGCRHKLLSTHSNTHPTMATPLPLSVENPSDPTCDIAIWVMFLFMVIFSES